MYRCQGHVTPRPSLRHHRVARTRAGGCVEKCRGLGHCALFRGSSSVTTFWTISPSKWRVNNSRTANFSLPQIEVRRGLSNFSSVVCALTRNGPSHRQVRLSGTPPQSLPDGVRVPPCTMGYAGYAPGHKVVELTVVQQLLKLIRSDKSLETLEKLTRNSAQAPAEEKFRKVRLLCA